MNGIKSFLQKIQDYIREKFENCCKDNNPPKNNDDIDGIDDFDPHYTKDKVIKHIQ